MGDYSNFTIRVCGVKDPRVITAIKHEVEEYGSHYYSKIITEGTLELGLNEVRVGTVEEVDDLLHRYVEKGFEDDDGVLHPVEDFYWLIHDEPEYDWLGTIRVHSPGVGDFDGMCDADGSPVIHATVIESMVAEATDLAELKEQFRKLTGADITDAFYDAIKENR